MRLLSMKQCWGHGQWVVRWVPELLFGYGYPLFNFYPPLFYFLGMLITKLGAGIIVAVNISLFLTIFLSGLAMYIFASEIWGQEGGLISAIAYLFAPYHIVDLYLRVAAAELAAFVFLPLIFWSFYKLQQTGQKQYIIFSALSSAGLLLTHNCTSVIVFPWVPLYILLLNWFYPSQGKLRSLLQSLGAMILGIGLAAIFWLPAFVEKKFVHTELLVQGNEDFHHNFLYFKDLMAPLWRDGLPYFDGPNLFCRLGPLHYLLILVVGIGFKKIAAQKEGLKLQIMFFTALFLAGIFCTLPYSKPIWEHIQVIQYLQFPSRFLTVVVMAGSILSGGIVLLVESRQQFIVTLMVVVAILGANFYYCHPRELRNIDLTLVQNDPEYFLNNLCLQDGGEYIPIWVKDGLQKMPGQVPKQKLESFNSRDVILASNKISPLKYHFRVQAQQLGMFCFNNFYFPGWRVKVDGNEVPILKENPFGLMVFPCPPGIHEVEIYFGTTPVRQWAQGITWGCIVVLIGILVFFK